MHALITISFVILLASAPGAAASALPADCAPLTGASAALQPITVGPRERFGEEGFADRQAKNAVRSVLGGLFGGGRNHRDERPRTRRDPTRKLDLLTLEGPVRETALGLRTRWTDDGLLISTRIEDSPDKGTFQTLYLEDCAGRRLNPTRLEVYDLWNEASISVGWSRSTYEDGHLSSQQTGGWSDSWTHERDGTAGDDVPAAGAQGIWRQAGYERAHGGLRQVGAYFGITPEELTRTRGLVFVAHVTRPAQDPVDTVPFQAVLTPGTDRPTLLSATDPAAASTGLPACTEASPEDLVCSGYAPPEGITLTAARGTGRTTGHIADIIVTNETDEPRPFQLPQLYIPSTHRFQSYVAHGTPDTTIPPGRTVAVPVEGYCSDVRKPPVPAGESLTEPDRWVVPAQPGATLPAPGEPGFVNAPKEARLISGMEAIARATERLQQDGGLQTPFSSDPDRERETVIQQTLWRYAAELDGEPYTREEFGGRLEAQYEERSGVPLAAAPEEDRERLASGTDDFWSAFELVGVEAKVLIGSETAAEDQPETVQDEGSLPPAEEIEPLCDIEGDMNHTDADSEFLMSENYQDEDKRESLSEWFDDLPEVADAEEGGTFEASKYPASAWAVAGRDFIGGYANAVAKHLFLEADGGQDMVWSTELLQVDADSRGTHTLTVTPPAGEDCETLVVGAAGGVVEAWSNAIDPIADSRGILEALRWVRDGAIIVASVALAPATAGASLAVGFGTMVATKAFDAEFTAAANAGAAAEGQMNLWVGTRKLALVSRSRSEVLGDGKVNSDGQKTMVGQISDTHPTTLSANTNGLSALKGEADDNGVAEATLESQTGVALVAFCRCGDAVHIEQLNDSGLFLVEEGAAGAATRAAVRLGEMLMDEIEPYLELPPEQVIPKARADLPRALEHMLEDWYGENGSGPGGTGYFGTPPGDGDS